MGAKFEFHEKGVNMSVFLLRRSISATMRRLGNIQLSQREPNSWRKWGLLEVVRGSACFIYMTSLGVNVWFDPVGPCSVKGEGHFRKRTHRNQNLDHDRRTLTWCWCWNMNWKGQRSPRGNVFRNFVLLCCSNSLLPPKQKTQSRPSTYRILYWMKQNNGETSIPYYENK